MNGIDYRRSPTCCGPRRREPEGDAMRFERNRLASFFDWPQWSGQRPMDLAEAGLFYTGLGDRVQCTFCSGVLKGWLSSDSPMEEHRVNFPYCQLMQGYNVENVPIMREIRIQATAQNFEDEEMRKTSFMTWPVNMSQKKEEMAFAGFYHIPSGDKPDRVRCVFCGGKMYNWKYGDDPLIEHARYFPKCPHMRFQVGKNIMDDLQIQHILSDSIAEIDQSDPPFIISLAPRPPGVHQVNIHKKRSARTPPTAKKPEKDGRKKPEKDSRKRRNDSGLTRAKMMRVVVEDEDWLCEICMDAPAEVIFLPCGHQASCDKCATVMSSCPVCEASITGCV